MPTFLCPSCHRSSGDPAGTACNEPGNHRSIKLSTPINGSSRWTCPKDHGPCFSPMACELECQNETNRTDKEPTMTELADGPGGPGPDASDVLYQQLTSWWRNTAEGDLEKTVPKAIEYGSADLKVMGAAMVALHPHYNEMDQVERDRTGQEMAIAFYLLGKVSRLFGAYQNGGIPSDDTWLDATVYAMMGRRVRSHGGWPTDGTDQNTRTAP